jgi:hypothetical protein
MTDNHSNDSASDYLNLFAAENLLATSPIMEQVVKLRNNISRNSDGNLVDYDDMLRRIQSEVDILPVLELQQNVAAGTEGAYQRQLLHALERINDDHDRVLRKLLKMKSRLVNAISLMKNQRSQFAAFYNLAIPVAIHATNIPKLKLSAANIKEMAAGEYSRLMDNLDQAAPSLISELEILELEIKGRKAAQAAKYALGKDQVNAMWNSFQSSGAIGMDDNPDALIRKFPVDEEDEDEIPSFVSRHTKEVRTAANASLVRPPQTMCSVCGEKQVDSPSGMTCINGHGGVEPDEDEEIGGFELKGTFFKKGDPKPITPISDEDGGDAVVIRTSRVIKMPDWSKERLEELAENEPSGVMACSPEIYEEIKANNEPDAEGLAAIAEIARKANAETMAEIEATHKTKMDKLTTIPIPELTNIEEILKVKTSVVDYPNEPLVVVDYKAKWDDLQPTTTKAVVIEDIEDDLQPMKVAKVTALVGEPVEDIESVLNDPEPLATVAPATPRKKLMIMEEDEL